MVQAGLGSSMYAYCTRPVSTLRRAPSFINGSCNRPGLASETIIRDLLVWRWNRLPWDS